MVDLDLLAKRARRAYEWGRARRALRVGVIVAGFTAASLFSGTAPAECLAGGALLLVVSVALRWWSQTGVEAVRVGLPLGGIPLAAGVVLQRLGVECGSWDALTKADLVYLLAALIAGSGVTLWVAQRPNTRLRRWLPALLVASLTALLGCVGLGMGGLVASLAALVTASAVAWIPVAVRGVVT